MVRVRLTENYSNWYWDSGNGVTLRKDDRVGVEVTSNNKLIELALDGGILEVVTDEELAKQQHAEKIISDIPDTSKTIKEVVSQENTKQLEKVKDGAHDKGA
jgi:TusA-related sulfurtransferase